MKRVATLILGLVMATGLAIASPVSAQEVSRTITIGRDSKVGGQALTKGEYSIKFVEGKDGSLVILKGGKEVAKAAYKSSKLEHPAAATSVVYNVAGDGSYQVQRLEFKGKSETVVFQ